MFKLFESDDVTTTSDNAKNAFSPIFEVMAAQTKKLGQFLVIRLTPNFRELFIKTQSQKNKLQRYWNGVKK